MTTKTPKPPEPNKSFIDNIFDIADQALTPLEAALGPGPEDRGTRGEVHGPGPHAGYVPEDPRPTNTKGQKVIDVGDAWEEYFWAYVTRKDNGQLSTWHAFAEGSLRAVCTEAFRSHEISNRCKLEHGKRIVACTSCIIGIATHG